MILCIGTTPAAQRVMVFRKLTLDAVNRAEATFEGAAGKSINVAKVLKAIGEDPLAAGFLGGPRGEQLRDLLQAQGVEGDFVQVNAPTRLCITVLDQSAGAQTELVEESRPVEPADYHELTARIAKHVKAAKAVVMSGTLTPGGPADFYFQCTRLAREAGAFSVVDAQRAPLLEALKAGPDLVKPNRSELAATIGRPLESESAVFAAMKELVQRGARRVVITAGKELTLAFDGHARWRVTPPRITAVNPIGSGDAFTAALTWRLVRGDDLGEASRWAAACGAANALTIMAGEVRREDVERLAREVVVESV